MKLYVETGEALPAIQILKDADPAPGGYDVATDDVLLWDKYGQRCIKNDNDDGLPGCTHFRDYKKLRSEIKARIETKTGFDPADLGTYTQVNWDKLSAAEKEVAARYFCVPPTGVAAAPLRDEIYTTAEQIVYGLAHHQKSVESRILRVRMALSELYNRLDIDDAREVEEELNQIPKGSNVPLDVGDNTTAQVKVKTMVESYVDRGIEGSVEDNGVVGLFDYTLSRAGTPFSATGLSSKAYAVIGMTDAAELGTRCHDVLANGTF